MAEDEEEAERYYCVYGHPHPHQSEQEECDEATRPR